MITSRTGCETATREVGFAQVYIQGELRPGYNIRDVADTHQLIILANLESLNGATINDGMLDTQDRLKLLRRVAVTQLKSLKASKDLSHQLIESPNLGPHFSSIAEKVSNSTPFPIDGPEH